MATEKPTGLTKDAGWQIGVRKTFDVSPDTAWEKFFSIKGLRLWLGETDKDRFLLAEPFTTPEGISGKLKLIKHLSHIRMHYQKKDWPNTSTLQIRVTPAGQKATISFHQEKLLDERQREEMKIQWQEVLDKIQELF